MPRTARTATTPRSGEARSGLSLIPTFGVLPDELAAPVVDRLRRLGYPPNDIGQVTSFDGGCIIKRRNRKDVSVVLGDDGGVAYFDPRWVDDLRAASEYRAGRGREPGRL